MMGSKARLFTPITAVSLDELVPANHFYRHLDRVVDHAGRARSGQKDLRRAGSPLH